MFVKLAFRNVRRQLGNYLIYFMTVALTVALMFAVDNMIFDDRLMRYAETVRVLRDGLAGLTALICAIVAFVLGYATSFLLRLRKREFGTYLTLGMTRKNILSLFIVETMILFAAALAAGIFLGLFLHQGLLMLTSGLMEIEFAVGGYSVEGLVFTVALMAVIYAVSSLASASYLKKAGVCELLRGDRKMDKTVRRPALWIVVTVVSFMAVPCAFAVFDGQVNKILAENAGNFGVILGCIFALAAGLFLFHMGLARSLIYFLLKGKRICGRGTNTFVLRQLSGTLGANSAMLGFLAFLLAFAVIGANLSFAEKIVEREGLNRKYPFDVLYTDDGFLQAGAEDTARDGQPVLPAQADPVIEKYRKITAKYPYEVYTTQDNYLYGFTRWSGEGYEWNFDMFMKESDFNRLCGALGYPQVRLNGTFLIAANTAEAARADFSDAALERGGRTYRFGGLRGDVPRLTFVHFYAVVPDEFVEGLWVRMSHTAYMLEEGKYDAVSLKKELTYSVTERYGGGAASMERCDYTLKEYGRMKSNSTVAVFIVGAVYMAAVFLLLSMAILALKIISGLQDDRRRYLVLFRLGAGEREQSRALFRQTFSFFFLPFAMPLLITLPSAVVSGRIMKLSGYSGQIGQVYTVAGAVAIVMTLFYLLYFTATYLIAKKAVVRTEAL